MGIKTEILPRRSQEKINQITEKVFGKRLFYTGILPDPYFRGVGEFGATASTIISDEIGKAKMEAYRARLRALPKKEAGDFPTIPE